MYYHIIRPDGSFVIQNSNTELGYFSKTIKQFKGYALTGNASLSKNSCAVLWNVVLCGLGLPAPR